MSSGLAVERKNREKFVIDTRIVDIRKIKQILYENTISNGIQISIDYFSNMDFTTFFHEKYSYYLQTLIMLKNYQDVDSFLRKHFNSYGQYATEMLVNVPLVSHVDKNIVTPLICAMLWSEEPEMVRVLYHWGADISVQDIDKKYPEEKYGSHYVNHMNAVIAPDFYVLGIRSVKQFVPIIEELKFISGELVPPKGWKKPIRAYSAHTIPQSPRANNTGKHA